MDATLPWSQTMQTCPLRLAPGDDLRVALEQSLAHLNVQAAFVLQGIGSLSCAQLRFAGLDEPTRFTGDYEILTLGGSLSPDGAHLHMSIADALGNVCGGHVAPGCSCARRPRCWSRCYRRTRFRGSSMRRRVSRNW
jgi:predicted DNA-binding protein with PD1-like motif